MGAVLDITGRARPEESFLPPFPVRLARMAVEGWSRFRAWGTFAGWIAFSRIRVRLFLLSVGLGTLSVSYVYAGEVAGKPATTLDVVVSGITLAMAVIGLINSWVKRVEKGQRDALVAAKAAAPEPNSGITNRVGVLEGRQEEVNRRIVDLATKVDEATEGTTRSLAEIRSAVEGRLERTHFEVTGMAGGLRDLARSMAERDRLEELRAAREREAREALAVEVAKRTGDRIGLLESQHEDTGRRLNEIEQVITDGFRGLTQTMRRKASPAAPRPRKATKVKR